MTDNAWLLAGLGLYLVVVLAVGFVTWRRMRTLDDFVLGGRSLSPFAAALSERASGESAWFLLGLPGAAYALGFREFWSVIGIASGLVVGLLVGFVGPVGRRTAGQHESDDQTEREHDGDPVVAVVVAPGQERDARPGQPAQRQGAALVEP